MITIIKMKISIIISAMIFNNNNDKLMMNF